MFTGLVERTGVVKEISGHQACTLVVDPGEDYEREHGASIAVDGVCLTECGTHAQGRLTFQVSPETLAKTTLGQLKPQSLVNLERAMRPTDRLGGHIVLGHVDGTGLVRELIHTDGFWLFKIDVSADLSRYVVKKGSIAINGVSLTVNELVDTPGKTVLSFMLVPVTWTTTSLQNLLVGQLVNIEVDMIAKHLERLHSAFRAT